MNSLLCAAILMMNHQKTIREQSSVCIILFFSLGHAYAAVSSFLLVLIYLFKILSVNPWVPTVHFKLHCLNNSLVR